MATFELIMLLALAVLLSSVLEQIIPRISIPLIQIALGMVISVFAVNPVSVSISPEFFLIVFIAPLLFNEAKGASKLALWKNRRYIISLAIGLVVAITLAVGFSINALIPSIPLAAAFALGAALGPTDAVAVSSLSEVAQPGKRTDALLQGEALINDASGVVAFQFAIAAAVTGSFSAIDAASTFAISFFGGIIVGVALAWVAKFITSRINDLGLDSNTFHVLFDIMLPFVIFFISEMLHVSGILAVVAAGIVLSAVTDRAIGPNVSRLNIVSNNVWSVITYALNGIVFVLLGVQLPQALSYTWQSMGGETGVLILYVLLLTAILVVVRFAWVLGAICIHKEPDTGKRPSLSGAVAREALVSTIGGPKGAITLSVILSTPLIISTGEAFPNRELLIFLASGVILCTLLLANFLLPVLAPKPKANNNDQTAQQAYGSIDILRRVINRTDELRTRENGRAVSSVIRAYKDRIERFQDEANIEQESTVMLRIEVMQHLQHYLTGLIEKGEIDEAAGYDYLKRISKSIGYLKHRNDSRWIFFQALRHTSSSSRALQRSLQNWRSRLTHADRAAAKYDVQLKCDLEALKFLSQFMGVGVSTYPSEVVAKLMLSYQRAIRAIQSTRPEITAYAKADDQSNEIERMAYEFELEEIRNAMSNGTIDRATANHMRDNVYLMLFDLDDQLA